MKITKHEAAILKVIKRHWEQYHLPPSLRWIAAEVGKGKTTVRYHVHNLIEQGLLEMEDEPHPTVRPAAMKVEVPWKLG